MRIVILAAALATVTAGPAMASWRDHAGQTIVGKMSGQATIGSISRPVTMDTTYEMSADGKLKVTYRGMVYDGQPVPLDPPPSYTFDINAVQGDAVLFPDAGGPKAPHPYVATDVDDVITIRFDTYPQWDGLEGTIVLTFGEGAACKASEVTDTGDQRTAVDAVSCELKTGAL